MPHRKFTFESFDAFAESSARAQRPVVSVGSFDGVHLGHKFLLNELIEWARREHAPAVVITFRRHPREVMTGREIPSLNTPEHKCLLLKGVGIDYVVMVEFTEDLQTMTAQEFLEQVVIDKLNARGMLVGFNNRIGKGGEGTVDVLQHHAKGHDLEVREAERIEVSGQAMSSSAIRKHVQNGDFLWARKMLGRPYSIIGPVIHGNQRGRTIGFPTANIALKKMAFPPLGVYGVRVRLDTGNYLGAANIGTRPTVDPDRVEPLLEVHVIDFEGDLYGQEIEIEFLFYVRGEQKFNGIDELTFQLQADIKAIQKTCAKEDIVA
ncbi:bifunctional riboflavin kinase/FAD synthetase [Planctomycetota bacterium]|nr:bifunctional riboflavin kinase/FAD synthetase [Planctomycetota bacterium]